MGSYNNSYLNLVQAKNTKNAIKLRWLCNCLYSPLLRGISVTLLGLLFPVNATRGDGYSFTNSLAQAAIAERHEDIPAVLKIYMDAQHAESNNASNLCVLARRYCDLTYLTNPAGMQKDVIRHALDCSLQAVKADPNNATAHASVAVCYAKRCAFADIKTQLAYSRLFKQEAEKAIALNPREDIAYYLLGHWNYEIAHVGLLSRVYVRIVYGGLPKASNQDAIANFIKAVKLAPERIIYHAGLAMACEADGEKQLAIAELKKCRAMKPSGPEDQEAQREAVKKLAAMGQ